VGYKLYLNENQNDYVNNLHNTTTNITYADPSTYRYIDQSGYMEYMEERIKKNYTVTLSTSHGSLTLISVTQKIVFLDGAGFQDRFLSFAGPLRDVNTALKGLNYKPDLNWNSFHDRLEAAVGGISMIDSIAIEVIDSDGLGASDSVSIFVKPANDPPVITIGDIQLRNAVHAEVDQLSPRSLITLPLYCHENIPCLLDLTVRDVDVGEAPDGMLKVRVRVRVRVMVTQYNPNVPTVTCFCVISLALTLTLTPN
jgi:hypothetical protein